MAVERATKIVAAAGFVLVAVAAVSAWSSPTTGYESSIYWATPPLVWGCLLFSIVCGLAIIVHQAYRGAERSNLWVIGFILILLSNTVILSLHILRGYAMWNAAGDTGTHLGIIQDIITASHFARSELFYPATHIYLAQLSQVLDISPAALVRWTPVLLAPLYMVFMYFLAKSILPGKRELILATAAAAALALGAFLTFSPFTIANLVFPMTLLFLFRSLRPTAWQWRVLLILMLFAIPVFHELPAVALAIMLLTIPLARILYGKLAGISRGLIHSGFRFSMIALLILLSWSGLWLGPKIIDVAGYVAPEESSVVAGVPGDVTIPSQLPEGSSHLTTLFTSIEYAEYYGYSVVQHFLKLYGDLSVYILLALIAIPILWRRTRKQDHASLASLYGPLMVIALLMVALFFTAVYFSPARFLDYIAIICTILTGFTLYKFIQWATSRRGRWPAGIAAFLVGVLLVSVSVNSVFTAYPSPYTLHISFQSTQAEIDGMDWYLHNKDTAIHSSGWYFAPRRYAAFLLSADEREQREDYLGNATHQLPFHLGYDTYPTMGQVYEEDTYVVLTELVRRHYVDVFPKMAELRLLPSDFAKMEDDPNVDKLYDNGELDVWYVHPQG